MWPVERRQDPARPMPVSGILCHPAFGYTSRPWPDPEPPSCSSQSPFPAVTTSMRLSSGRDSVKGRTQGSLMVQRVVLAAAWTGVLRKPVRISTPSAAKSLTDAAMCSPAAPVRGPRFAVAAGPTDAGRTLACRRPARCSAPNAASWPTGAVTNCHAVTVRRLTPVVAAANRINAAATPRPVPRRGRNAGAFRTVAARPFRAVRAQAPKRAEAEGRQTSAAARRPLAWISTRTAACPTTAVVKR